MHYRSIALVTCLVLLPLVAYSQGEPGWGNMSLGATAEVSLPVGDFSKVAGTGYGGNVKYQLGVDSRSVFTATLGYLAWSTKDVGTNATAKPNALNLFAGGKYYFFPGFYGSLEAGLYFINFKYEGTVAGLQGSGTRFMVPIGVGFQKSGFEVGVRYMFFHPDLNSFSITAGYNFAL